MNLHRLFDAVSWRDDRSEAKRLLRANPKLATDRIREAKLYQNEIIHWIYAGDTALHLAAAGSRVEIIKLLLAAGADPNAAMNHRRSGPLHYAADGRRGCPAWSAERQVESIQCLIAAGAEINAADKNGATPLHRAVRTRAADAVRCLLKLGCDPLRRNLPGSTPFHLAVQNTGASGSGSEDAKAAQRLIIKEFMSLGLSVRLKDGNGRTVVDCAQSAWIRDLLRG